MLMIYNQVLGLLKFGSTNIQESEIPVVVFRKGQPLRSVELKGNKINEHQFTKVNTFDGRSLSWMLPCNQSMFAL